MNKDNINLFGVNINPGGVINNTTEGYPVVTYDQVAVELNGTNAFNKSFVSLETVLSEIDTNIAEITENIELIQEDIENVTVSAGQVSFYDNDEYRNRDTVGARLKDIVQWNDIMTNRVFNVYNEGSAYSQGDICLKDNKVILAKQNINEGSTYTSNDWQTNENLSCLISQITNDTQRDLTTVKQQTAGLRTSIDDLSDSVQNTVDDVSELSRKLTNVVDELKTQNIEAFRPQLGENLNGSVVFGAEWIDVNNLEESLEGSVLTFMTPDGLRTIQAKYDTKMHGWYNMYEANGGVKVIDGYGDNLVNARGDMDLADAPFKFVSLTKPSITIKKDLEKLSANLTEVKNKVDVMPSTEELNSKVQQAVDAASSASATKSTIDATLAQIASEGESAVVTALNTKVDALNNTVRDIRYKNIAGGFDSISTVKGSNIACLTYVTAGLKDGMADNYIIAYYKATNDEEDVTLNYTKGDTYQYTGKVFIVDSESEIVNGYVPTLLTRYTEVGTQNTYKTTLQQNQCLCVSVKTNQDVYSFTLSGIDINSFRIKDYVTTKEELNDKFYIDEKILFLRKSSMIYNNTQLKTEDVAADYVIAYYEANESCKITIDYIRRQSYSYSGKVFIVNSKNELVEGNAPTVIKQFDNVLNNEELFTYTINQGQCLCISTHIKDKIIFRKRTSSQVNLSNLYNDNYIPTNFNGKDICTFNKILCIGDSLTYGTFNTNPISGQTFPSRDRANMYGYPTFLKKLTGSDVVNLATAGYNSTQWFDNYKDDEKIIGCDCAIIQLGVNDTESTLDTVSRTAFINIIDTLKEKNKGIIIFLAGIINGASNKCESPNESYYVKDQFIKSLYNELYANDNQVYLIDHAKYGHLRDLPDTYNNYNEGHLSAMGYCRLAQDYFAYISYIMHTDKTNSFKNILFIGTDFSYK